MLYARAQAINRHPTRTCAICRRCCAVAAAGAQKNGPENRGHSSKVWFQAVWLNERSDRTNAGFTGSKPEIGEIAVTHRHAGAGHQQAVDGDHQAAEQGSGGREADGSRLGHNSPLLGSAAGRCITIWGQSSIPDASNNAFVCIAAYCLLQCSKNGTIRVPDSKRPPESPTALKRDIGQSTRRRPSAAGRARRNRGSPPPDDR